MGPSPIIKVLLVDDEDRFRETLSRRLANRGFDTATAGGGKEALERICKERFDVILLDVQMPGTSGNEVLAELRRRRPELPVIMLTGRGSGDSLVKGLQDGVFDYLGKPCDTDLLVSRIRDAYQARRPLFESERRVIDLMIPLSEYSVVKAHETVGDAVRILMQSFLSASAESPGKGIGHHSVLVLDDGDAVVGVISFTSLLAALQAPYANKLKASLGVAQAIHIEPLAYRGMFIVNARELAKKEIADIMIEPPPEVDGHDNLMAAVNAMVTLGSQRLLVRDGEAVVGIIRKQDLFFELARRIQCG